MDDVSKKFSKNVWSRGFYDTKQRCQNLSFIIPVAAFSAVTGALTENKVYIVGAVVVPFFPVWLISILYASFTKEIDLYTIKRVLLQTAEYGLYLRDHEPNRTEKMVRDYYKNACELLGDIFGLHGHNEAARYIAEHSNPYEKSAVNNIIPPIVALLRRHAGTLTETDIRPEFPSRDWSELFPKKYYDIP